jgi:hypothetical protein
MVLLGILLIAAGILILALGRFPHATTVGLIVAVAGVAIVLVAALDTSDASAAAVFALPLPGRLGRLRYWTHWHNLRHEFDRRLDMLCLSLAIRMPARLRLWVVVDSTNTARQLYPDPTGYAGPNGLEYRHIHDGALRGRA